MDDQRKEETTPIVEGVELNTTPDQGVGAEPSTSGPAIDDATADRTDASTSQIGLRTHPDGVPMDLEQHTLPDTAEIDSSTNPDQVATTDADAEWNGEDYMHDLRRVKVYELIGTRWTDRGTAFCTGDYDDEAQEARLVAKSEINQEVLLRCTIRGNDVYQRQQDTLIVWTEPDGTDFALSFQDIEGCAEVWDFIIEVQRHLSGKADDLSMSSPLIGPPAAPTVQSILTSGRLPDPALGIIPEIDRAIKMISRAPTSKERICEYIIQEDYIKGLIEVMNQAEDLESLDDLHALCTCMQTILLLNDHSIYEYVLHDDVFFGVVGMMEYDPDFPTWKASYRDFLRDVSRFRQVVEVRDETIVRKIHQTYRLQYLKDVVMARVLDDPTFTVLNSCIIFNQIDILNHVQQDGRFLQEVISMFVAEDPKGKGKEPESPVKDAKKPEEAPSASQPAVAQVTDEKRADVMVMLHQLCAMGKNVQLPARLALFRSLVDRGILFAVQWALGRTDKKQLNTAGEILSVLLEHDVSGVRGHVLKQMTATEDNSVGGGPTILADLARMLAGTQDLALKSQMAESLRSLMDVPSGDLPGDALKAGAMKAMARILKEDPVTERFLDYFYKSCVDTLFKPLHDVPEYKAVTDVPFTLSRDKSNLYLYLSDLLCSFALQHSFRSHFFILSSNLSPRIATLLSSREKHLRLGALRFFRTCLKLNNRNLFTHLIKHDVFLPILDLTHRESKRDNLLSSSCQEFFEHIRRENLRELIEHLMKKYEEKIQQLSDSPVVGARFKGLIRRWEQNTEPPPKPDQAVQQPQPSLRRWGQGKLMEAEEEDYFNGSDEEEAPAPGQWSRAQVLSTANGNAKRRRGRPGQLSNVTLAGWSNGTPQRPQRPANVAIPRAPPMGGLVDYDEDDDQTASDDTTPQPIEAESSTGPQKLAKSLPSTPGEAAPLSPSIPPSTPPGSLRAGEKRPRDDDDDEGFERLTRSKRQSLGPSQDRPATFSTSPTSSPTPPAHPTSSSSPTPQTNGTHSPTAAKPANTSPIPKKAAKEDPKKMKVKLNNLTNLSSLVSTPPEQPPPVQEVSPKVGDQG